MKEPENSSSEGADRQPGSDRPTPEEEIDVLAVGDRIRRSVLGSAYVDAALADNDDFGADLQRIITTYCWGEVWGRPGLDLPTRSLLNVGILAALDRPNELALHTRGALRNGCRLEQIQEVLLQVAIYCGVPAALDGLRVARRVAAEG